MKKLNAAFTLIELLVVIAIIATLSSLAIPHLIIAFEKGKVTKDINNLHSLGQGLAVYLAENQADMPSRSAPVPWPQALHKPVPDWRAFKSDFDPRGFATNDPYPVSYGLNENVYDTSTSAYSTTSELILMAPLKQAEKGPLAFPGLSTSNPTVPTGKGFGTHSGGTRITALFADFHAGEFSVVDFRDSISTRGRARWFPQ